MCPGVINTRSLTGIAILLRGDLESKSQIDIGDYKSHNNLSHGGFLVITSWQYSPQLQFDS